MKSKSSSNRTEPMIGFGVIVYVAVAIAIIVGTLSIILSYKDNEIKVEELKESIQVDYNYSNIIDYVMKGYGAGYRDGVLEDDFVEGQFEQDSLKLRQILVDTFK